MSEERDRIARMPKPGSRGVSRRAHGDDERAQNILICDTHGRTVWEGTIACGSCLRIFQTADESAALYAPEVCPCGKALISKDPGEATTGRSICSRCFDDGLANGGVASFPGE